MVSLPKTNETNVSCLIGQAKSEEICNFLDELSDRTNNEGIVPHPKVLCTHIFR